MHANSRDEIKEARAGDIVALVGMKSTTTGDTLSDSSDKQVSPGADGVPGAGDRGFGRARRPRLIRRSSRLALGKLAAEDPSFRVGTDAEPRRP